MAERRVGWRVVMWGGEGIAFAGGLAVAVGAALPWASFQVFRIPIVLPGILLGGAFTVAAAAGGLALLRRIPLLTILFGLLTLYIGLQVREQVGVKAREALIHVELAFVPLNARLAQIGASPIDPVPSLKRDNEYLGPGIAITLYGAMALSSGAGIRVVAERMSRRCRKCGLVWRVSRLADLRFCPRCGETAAMPRGGHSCPECRHPMYRKDRFCAHCGAAASLSPPNPPPLSFR
jgi:hypothetical protein